MTHAKIVPSKIAHAQRLKSFCSNAALILTTLTLMVAVAATVATAQTYTALFNFDDTHGVSPTGGLAQGRDGNLYGTTFAGGANNFGVVFKIRPNGNFNVVYDFDGGSHGGWPAGLTLGTNGDFYGTTSAGGDTSCDAPYGCGTVFKMTSGGNLTTLYSFTGGEDGQYPFAAPIQGNDGNLYGTTYAGTVYKITPSGIFTPLGPIPEGSQAPLLQGTDGNLYGTDYYGGSSGFGSVFKVTPKGIVTTVYSFDGPHGTYPLAAVILGSDRNLYGTASEGGANNNGVAFKLTSQGTLTALHSFPDPNLLYDGHDVYAGLVQASDGNLYGVARSGGSGGGGYGFGVIFQITLAGAYSILYNFDDANGGDPRLTPTQHTNGKFYGLTQFGGTSGQGVLYSFDLGLAPFVSLVSAVGKAGKTVEILGQGLTGTTSVAFGGTPTTFKVFSETYLTATAPRGVTSDLVTVTTPTGTLTSNKPFRVLPTLLNFSPSGGPVGTPVTITGVSLTQTQSIRFGWVKATDFTVNSDTQVTVTVPAGAKTGNIQLTTLGGQVFSQGIFTVTH